MTPNEIANLVITVLGGGLVGSILTGFVSAKKLPIEKRTAEVQNASEVNQIALSTLKTVDEKLKEVSSKYEKLESKVILLEKEFEEQSSLLTKLQAFIRNILENWDVVRLKEYPPELPYELNEHFRKE